MDNRLGDYIKVPCQYRVVFETDANWSYTNIYELESHADFRVYRDSSALKMFDTVGGYHENIISYVGWDGKHVYKKTLYIKDLEQYSSSNFSGNNMVQEIIKFNRNKSLQTLLG